MPRLKKLLTPPQKPTPINMSRLANVPKSRRTKFINQRLVLPFFKKMQTPPICPQKLYLRPSFCTVTSVLVEHESPGFNTRRIPGGVSGELVVWYGRNLFERREMKQWLMADWLDNWLDNLLEGCSGRDRGNERVMLRALKAKQNQSFGFILIVSSAAGKAITS